MPQKRFSFARSLFPKRKRDLISITTNIFRPVNARAGVSRCTVCVYVMLFVTTSARDTNNDQELG